ncbi:hypothetical protein F4775DRAFT_6335 [Biscogniauxia sp. FL1348]|nr:hypothetical protein F4775DRAFT_6335 [Biscogniauxia sp. FL1348]
MSNEKRGGRIFESRAGKRGEIALFFSITFVAICQGGGWLKSFFFFFSFCSIGLFFLGAERYPKILRPLLSSLIFYCFIVKVDVGFLYQSKTGNAPSFF